MRTSDAFMRTTTTLLLRRRRRFKDGRFVSVRARKKLNRLLRLHNAIKKTLAYTLSLSWGTLVLTYLMPLSHWGSLSYLSLVCCSCYLHCCYTYSLSFYLSQSLSSSCGTPINSLSPAYAPF